MCYPAHKHHRLTVFHTHAAPIAECVHKILAIQAFRPDRLMAATHQLVNSIMGVSFTAEAETELNLAQIIESEVKPSTPILMCSVPGYDASGRVDDLAAELNKPCTAIAIGKLFASFLFHCPQ